MKKHVLKSACFLDLSKNSRRVGVQTILISMRFYFECLFAGFHVNKHVLKSACFFRSFLKIAKDLS